jgi:hypothetical protein
VFVVFSLADVGVARFELLLTLDVLIIKSLLDAHDDADEMDVVAVELFDEVIFSAPPFVRLFTLIA